MKKSEQLSSLPYTISEKENGEIIFHLKEKIDISKSASILKSLSDIIKKKHPLYMTADLADVTHLDDYGAVMLLRLKNLTAAEKGNFTIINASDKISKTLAMVESGFRIRSVADKEKKQANVFVQVGEATIEHAFNLRFLVSFFGSVVLSLVHVLLHPKLLRTEDTLLCMKKTGVDAIPIVGLISFLLGLIIAFVSSLQLQDFGVNIYVASLVALVMVSELGPIMTAIVVSGRSGSAFAAEIGSMKISEEIDALFTMGFDPTLFLTVPKIVASIIVVPILTFFSDIFAVAGGLVVGVFMLDLTPSSYMSQTLETLTLFDISWGILKSSIFAFLIATVACLRGSQAGRGPVSVGNAATSAVVSGIFLIILFDSIFAVIRCYW
jgi:phospholipid/cholesterol/gamma-HCH transport system permease protein